MNSSYSYTESLLTVLEAYLSRERLAKYRQLAGGDAEKAMRLYVWNTELAEALYSPLQTFEISLRNAVDRVMSKAYGADWLDNFPWEFREIERINEVKVDLLSIGLPTNPSNMLAALSFGFWVSLFDRNYENDLWRPHLRKALPCGPDPLRRKNIFGIVNSVRKLRNRIAHHEPILQRKLDDDYRQIIEFISWIEKDLADWVHYHSHFETVWSMRPV